MNIFIFELFFHCLSIPDTPLTQRPASHINALASFPSEHRLRI